MQLLLECIQALKYPAFWKNTNNPSLKSFLEFRSQAGDLDSSTVEHNRYSKELNTICKYYAEASEFGKLVKKWKKDFKDSKNSKIIKLFWNMEHVVMEFGLVNKKSELQWKQGILEFERTGLRHLQETSSAVQEKQITYYERSTSKSATQTKKGESSSTKMVLREKRRMSYIEPETDSDSDSYKEKKSKKSKRVGSTSNTNLKPAESPQPVPKTPPQAPRDSTPEPQEIILNFEDNPKDEARKKTVGFKRAYESGDEAVNQQKKTKSESADERMSTPTDDSSDSTTTPTTKRKPKYIQHDLAQELLTSLRLLPLEGKKWLWDGYDVCEIFQDDVNIRTPLHIGVVNFHNILCSRSLPSSMITYIQQQLENDDDDRIFFDENRQRGIAKFGVEIDKEVEEFLEKFQDCETLDALRKTLYDNSVYKRSGYNFDIKYAYQFFSHMYNIYSNDMLIRPLTETEYAAYVWTPLIRYAFMEQDIRISSGEVGSLAYEKLKKLAQQQSKSGPKLDAKATIISTGMEVLVQENAKTDIASKRKNDLDKLEYCTKILLTNAYLSLPTTTRQDIHKFETYTIQTNELTLTLSAASYLFENTVCMLGLTDILIPRTVEAFSKCVEAVYKVLSWKARSCRNTRTFHGLLKRSASQLSKKKNFSPKMFTDPNLVAEHYRRSLK